MNVLLGHDLSFVHFHFMCLSYLFAAWIINAGSSLSFCFNFVFFRVFSGCGPGGGATKCTKYTQKIHYGALTRSTTTDFKPDQKSSFRLQIPASTHAGSVA